MSRRAFTLVELAIVLSVVSVVAAYVVPDFIEMARTNLAEKAAKDMLQIQEASRWFLHDKAEEVGDAERGKWPGELMTPKGFGRPAPCTSCCGGPRGELVSSQYLNDGDFTNPWGTPYQLTLERRGAGEHQDCQLVVSTTVPAGVAGVIRTYLPDARCDVLEADATLCPGTAGTNEDRCCSRTVKPGYEASLQALVPLACDQLQGAEWDIGVTGEGECNTQANLTPLEGGNCYWSTEGLFCRDGYVIMGGRRVSCGKGCEATESYCCKAMF